MIAVIGNLYAGIDYVDLKYDLRHVGGKLRPVRLIREHDAACWRGCVQTDGRRLSSCHLCHLCRLDLRHNRQPVPQREQNAEQQPRGNQSGSCEFTVIVGHGETSDLAGGTRASIPGFSM